MAEGIDWLGFETTRSVLYVNLESRVLHEMLTQIRLT
jgi:hypothetical protein